MEKKHRNNHIMNSNPNLESITDDAKSLIDATADATEDTVVKARNRLTTALDAAKEACATLQRKAGDTARATDHIIRERPYQAIGIAFGLGALLGFLVSRRGNDR